MLKYKAFSVAFSYPGDDLFALFPELLSEGERLASEHDRLFRANEIWLYGVEYSAKNEFQRSKDLADIMGFYRAFGLEPNGDRPDSLSAELEFMYYLAFKQLRALESGEEGARDKALICLDAQRRFFAEHLYPAAKRIGEAIASQTENDFYRDIAERMLEFLESERRFLGRME
ncbi:MAG: TorD/DmsD family molecular chaperone [bacterium]